MMINEIENFAKLLTKTRESLNDLDFYITVTKALKNTSNNALHHAVSTATTIKSLKTDGAMNDHVTYIVDPESILKHKL